MTLAQTAKLKIILTDAHNDFEVGLNKRAFFKVSNHELGEDLVQNTFIKTWSYLLKGGKIVTMKAFLYHILNNLIIDEYRKHKTTSLDTLLEKGFEPSIDNSKKLINTLDGKKAFILIQRLPLKYQQVMEMKFIKELTLEEMAKITKQSKNTLAVQVHRGIDLLKTLYITN
jgi:RNA polymerase sigma-70 factor (ECF subfamily)